MKRLSNKLCYFSDRAIFQTDYIRDIIYGPRDMCSTGPSSQQDFIVINQDGVYVYDEVADLTVGPCKGPLEFTSVFGGYSDLTSVDQVSGLLLYQNSVELFSTGECYKAFTIINSLIRQFRYRSNKVSLM